MAVDIGGSSNRRKPVNKLANTRNTIDAAVRRNAGRPQMGPKIPARKPAPKAAPTQIFGPGAQQFGPKNDELPGRPVRIGPRPMVSKTTPYGPMSNGYKTAPKKPEYGPRIPVNAPRPAPSVPRGAAAPPRPASKGPAAPKMGSPVGSKGPGGGGSGGGSAPKGGGSATKLQSQADSLKSFMNNASSAVQAELAPALNELNRQIQEMSQRGNDTLSKTADQGRRSESDLGELFGRLSNFTGQVKEAGQKNYAELNSQMGTRYDQLAAAQGQNFGAAKTAANAENDRLGLGGTGQGAIDKMTRDQAYLQGLAGTDKAAAQTGMSQSASSFDQLMSMAQNTAVTEGSVRVGQSRRDTDNAMNDTRREMEFGLRDLAGKRGDIEQGRGEKIRQLVEAMQDKAYNRNVESQDREFSQNLATKRFGMEKQQFDQAQIPVDPTEEDILKVLTLRQEYEGEAARRQAELDRIRFGPTTRIPYMPPGSPSSKYLLP